MRARSWLHLVLATSLTTAYVAACGSDDSSVFNGGPDGGDDSSLTGDDGGNPVIVGDAFATGDSQSGFVFTVDPQSSSVVVKTGTPTPTVQLTARANGNVVTPIWSIDRGELGSVDASGLFTPGGHFGGTAKITASYQGRSVVATIDVKIIVVQNGMANLADAGVDSGDGGTGAGGYGGVGGDGPGGAITPQQQAVLDGAHTTDATLKWLYPYDKTVWPRGLLPPLLQWQAGSAGDYDTLYVHLKENAYEFQGYFAKPATAATFIRHPIPADVWRSLATSNTGEDVTVEIVVAKGATAYAPATQETWKIAQGSLKGIVYYNSYGTNLAHNYTGALPGNGAFGGATLGIKGGSTDPVLVAGSNGNADQCRVCHSVSANGATLITQRNTAEKFKYSSYDLKTGNETLLSPEGVDGYYSWSAIYPDGTFFLSDSSSMSGSTSVPSTLYGVPQGLDAGATATPPKLPATGLPPGLRAAMPSFSPDGKHVAFNFFAAYGDAGVTGDKKSLATMTFDATTKTFSAFDQLVTPAGGHTAEWPSFLPTNDAIVYQVETRYNGRDFGGTRSDCDSGGSIKNNDPCHDVGAHGELWWLDLKTKTPVRLDKLNGLGYVPTGPNGHDDDTTLNYEPTVSPVPSGGYAWVVFTSRRLYGNVATINPFYSDPRYKDISQTPTPKKLWVAAIDLNAPAGTDPSHPAFYVPAQELMAGNSRGYWVVDPCKQDGNGCESGDECCGGYCRPAGDGGALVCSNVTPQSTCAEEFEKCTIGGDAGNACCNGLSCINGRCAIPTPK